MCGLSSPRKPSEPWRLAPGGLSATVCYRGEPVSTWHQLTCRFIRAPRAQRWARVAWTPDVPPPHGNSSPGPPSLPPARGSQSPHSSKTRLYCLILNFIQTEPHPCGSFCHVASAKAGLGAVVRHHVDFHCGYAAICAPIQDRHSGLSQTAPLTFPWVHGGVG